MSLKIKRMVIPFAIAAGLAGAGLPAERANAQEPLPSEQVVQVDSTGLKLRTALIGAKTISARKKALKKYGEWILKNKDPNEARYFMNLVSYKRYTKKMEWEAGGYLAGMIGLGIVPTDTAVAVWAGIGCPVKKALSFVHNKLDENTYINTVYNFALYKKIQPVEAVKKMARTKTKYGLARAVELIGVGQQQVGKPEAVVDALSVYGDMQDVMQEILGVENLWKNLPYMVGLLDGVVKGSNQNERPANMSVLGNAVYERVKAGGTPDLARWFIISQFKNSATAADQYASQCFLLYGAGFYASADTVVGLAKNSGSNPDSVLQTYLNYYKDGKVGIESYLNLVQKSGEFYYCTPEQAVEYMAKTGNKKGLERAIGFIEKYKALAGNPENLSRSLYSHFQVLDVFNRFVESKIENKTTIYRPFYSNAIYFAKIDEADRVAKRVAKQVDGNYELARKVYEDLSKKDGLKAESFAHNMIGNALKDFGKRWDDWVKQKNTKTEIALDDVLLFLVKNYGKDKGATDRLNSILMSNRYTEVQKSKIRRRIELEARTNQDARAALQALDARIKSSQAQELKSERKKNIKDYLSQMKKLGVKSLKQLDGMDGNRLKADVKKGIKEMAGSITTFESDINEMLKGKKGIERKILIWTIVEAVCEGRMSAPVLIAMKLAKDPVFNRQEAEEILARITSWNAKQNAGLTVQINEVYGWVQEHKK